MIGVGNVGQPRSVPGAPSASAVQAALDLMVGLGSDNKGVQRTLTDLKSAILHNEKLLADVQHNLAQVGDLERREAELVEREASVDAKLAELAAIRVSFAEYEKSYG